MEAFTQDLVNWILTLSPLSIYTIFVIVAYTENIIPPIPGDILVVFGGYLAAESVISFSVVLGLTTVASVVGFMSFYAIGAYWGDQIEIQRKRFWMMRFIDVKYFDKAKRWMQRWGLKVVLANRFLAGTRSVISLTAGITKTKVYPTILNSTLSSLLWNGILLWLGWLVHENWQVIGNYLNIYGTVILAVIAIIIATKLLYNYRKKRKKKF
jgi:membrane protein DedA with SNARE-associated domain